MNNVKERFEDMVNNPPHYADRQYEVIDVMKDTMSKERFVGYLEGCTVKYLMRWDKKGSPTENLKKAQWYLERWINEVEKGEIQHVMAR